MSPKSANGKSPTRRSRGSLSQEEIVSGAIELAERDGLDGLSMPNLARHLGAGVMSLYWYFHSKDDLLGAMAERVMGELYEQLVPVGDGPWESEVTRMTAAYAAELRRTPLFVQLCCARPRLVLSRPRALPMLVGRLHEETQLHRRLGVSDSEALTLYKLFVAYTHGYVMMQLGANGKTAEPSVDSAFAASVAELDPEQFPLLRALDDPASVVSVSDDDFESFLELLVSGMQAGT